MKIFYVNIMPPQDPFYDLLSRNKETIRKALTYADTFSFPRDTPERMKNRISEIYRDINRDRSQNNERRKKYELFLAVGTDEDQSGGKSRRRKMRRKSRCRSRKC